MVTPPVLAILQARMGSSRLPGKALLPLNGKPIVVHCVERAREAFGHDNVIAAIPDTPANAELKALLDSLGVPVYAGDELNVLDRFYRAAHTYRWRPDSVIVRVTCDDPFKEPEAMQRVASGERLPVELGAEAFTLAMLDQAWRDTPHGTPGREHVSYALFPVNAPVCDKGPGYTVDTPEDYEAAKVIAGETPKPAKRAKGKAA